ncbi:hypothetical protein ACH4FX_06605 [Streptomyces sp. NPDC018019]|uniref:hypothetical protein n=1 Tax=Streptomyces sp. NPDC018019 TaxID=3365030 RepID=UPI0037936390
MSKAEPRRVHHHPRGVVNASLNEKSADMRHRIRRFAARVRELLSPTPTTPFTTHRTPLRPSPRRVSRVLDTPLDGDASALVRPYLVAFEVRAYEQQARFTARIAALRGEFAA